MDSRTKEERGMKNEDGMAVMATKRRYMLSFFAQQAMAATPNLPIRAESFASDVLSASADGAVSSIASGSVSFSAACNIPR